ncbi:hypothetical protein [Hoylesella saccharolytica]|nr:hypothetical protein [Hoylesella saccharolytica]
MSAGNRPLNGAAEQNSYHKPTYLPFGALLADAGGSIAQHSINNYVSSV